MPSPIATVAPAAPSTTPTTPAAPAAAPAEDVAALRARLADAETKASAADKKMRVHSIEQMKFRDEKKGLGSKLTEHASYDKAFKTAGLTPADLINFKVNPEPVFKKVFGDSWYEKIVELRLNGGAPTADVVAAEIARAKEETVAEVRAELAREKGEAEKAEQQRMDSIRGELTDDAGAFLEKSWKEYPIFEGYQKAGVAKAIAQYIEAEYVKTGKALTNKEAADALESYEISKAERIAGIEKYQGRLTQKLKPATVAPAVGSRGAGITQSERRTLSNDLTATTAQAKRTPRTDEDRRAAIMALQLSKP